MAADLRWDDAHDGSPALTGYLGDRIVAQVVHYDVVAGGGPGWVGFVRGERVTGRCGSAETACRLVGERFEPPS